MVADLDVLHELSDGNDDTGTLVSSNKGQLGVKRPVSLPCVEIGMADWEHNQLSAFNTTHARVGTNLQ